MVVVFGRIVVVVVYLVVGFVVVVTEPNPGNGGLFCTPTGPSGSAGAAVSTGGRRSVDGLSIALHRQIEAAKII